MRHLSSLVILNVTRASSSFKRRCGKGKRVARRGRKHSEDDDGQALQDINGTNTCSSGNSCSAARGLWACFGPRWVPPLSTHLIPRTNGRKYPATSTAELVHRVHAPITINLETFMLVKQATTTRVQATVLGAG